jgi:hypothetical protein
MGFSLTWCAVPQIYGEGFLQALGLVRTGETEKHAQSLITSAQLDTGWQLLLYYQYQCPFLQEADLRRISADHDVIFCLVEEHVMASSSELWSGGKRKWWLSHEGENGPKGLAVEGEPPDSCPPIQDEMERSQAAAGGDRANVDYIFEIPLRVAQSLVGFKHDEICQHLGNGQYAVLSRAGSDGGSTRRFSRG